MGRPRKHDDAARARMVDAAERAIGAGGPDALSVRSIADDVGTTTWAVYSLFGSRDGLLAAVATRALEVLEEGMRAARETADPVEDLIDLGVHMYRRFAVDHPWLFRLAFQRVLPALELGPGFFAVRESVFGILVAKVQRLKDAGLLGPRTAREGAVTFNALCEGLANAEVRGGTMIPGDQEQVWRASLAAMAYGFAAVPSKLGRARRRRTT